MTSFSSYFSGFGKRFKEAADDVAMMQAVGYQLREGIKTNMRADFKAKLDDPKTGKLAKLGYKAGIALTYIPTLP